MASAALIGAHSSANLQKNVERSLKIQELFKERERMAEDGRGFERMTEDGRGWQRMERSEGLGVEKEY